MPKEPVNTAKVEATVALADAFQRSAKDGSGKYAHVPLATVDAELSVTTTEYVTPSGETGYQIICIAENGASSRSHAIGAEAESRTWGWRKKSDLNL